MTRTRIVTTIMLLSGLASAEPHNPTVYGSVADFTNLWAEYHDVKSGRSALVILGDGGMICGPFKFFGYDDKGMAQLVMEIKLGRCTGGFYPDVYSDRPERAP